jgi:glycosyltransferase involved in cell wall biosynthesis
MNRICFGALYAYPLFNPTISHIFGGAEVRAWLFGVGLSKLPNNEISFVVLNHGQPWIEDYGFIKIYRHTHYRASSTFTTRLTGRIQTLLYRLGHLYRSTPRIDDYPTTLRKYLVYEKVDADLYCTFGVSDFSAELAAFCRRHKKKFALFSSCDSDFSPDYYPASRKRNIYGSTGSLCYYTIMQADLIVTQTQTQSELLMKRFGRTSATVSSPIELTPTEKVGSRVPEGERVVLWIGKSDRKKRPEILLDLALRFPDIRFLMVLNKSDPKIHAEVLQRKPKNVRILETVGFPDVGSLFAKSFLLINTSAFEGFPNTFLQAGKYGVPILSLQVDPDGFIESHQCGIVAKGDSTGLIDGLKRIKTHPDLWQNYSRNIRSYVFNCHELNAKVIQLNQILSEFLGHGFENRSRIS